MMWADWTPPLIASTQAASFGRMPPLNASSAAADLVTVASGDQRVRVVGIVASQPSTSVRKIAL